MAQDRVTVQEAARRLGVKEDAIRKRIRRETLRHEKGADGRMYVFLDAAQAEEKTTQAEAQDAGRGELVEELRDRVRFLERQLERKDHLLAGLIERIPELEAPTSPDRLRESPESAEPRSDRVETPDEPPKPAEANTAPRRPWYRRLF